MPNDNIESSVSINYDPRGLQKAIADASKYEDALDDAAKSLNTLEKQISGIDGSIDLSINADLSTLDKLQSSLGSTEGLKITPLVDDSAIRGIDSLLSGLDAPTIKLNADDSELAKAEKLLIRIDAMTPTVKIDAQDSEIGTADRAIDDLTRTETVDVDVTGDPENDPDVTAVMQKLDELRGLAVIEIAMNFADTLPKPEDVPILGAIVDSANAAAKLEASLGSGFRPAQTQLTDDVYTGGLAESRDEAAGKVATTLQMVGNEAGNATFTNEALWDTIENGTYTAINLGAEYEQVMLAAKNMVANDLAPSLESAFDMMNVAQQRGLNMSGDLLDTIIEYAPHFKEMGLSAEEAFNVMEVASKNGVMNLDKVADGIKEFQVKLAEAVSDPESAPGKVFEKMGLTDELAAYKAGELTGAELARGIDEAATKGLANGTLNKQDMFDLFGSPGEDLTIPVMLDVIGASGEGGFANVEGTADQVSNLLGTSLDASITTAQRLIETKVAESVDKAFGIQEKIDQFNTGISEWAELVQGGESITGAAEKAFNIAGLEDAFNRFESTVGNLVIELATISANILEGLGNKGAADTIRGGVADASERQLTFDLKLAEDGAGITSAVDTAIRRGVDSADIGTALTTAGSEFILAGDFEGAKEYLVALNSLSSVSLPPDVAQFLSGAGIDPTNLKDSKAALEDFITTSQNVLGRDVVTANNMIIDTNVLQSALAQLDYAGAAQQSASDLRAQFEPAYRTALSEMWTSGDLQGGMDLASAVGDTATFDAFKTKMEETIGTMPDYIEEQARLSQEPMNNFKTAATSALDDVNNKVTEILPTVGTTIDTNLNTPTITATANINTLAETITAQVPVITEQTAQMQTDMGATTEKADTLNNSSSNLNKVSMGGLMGQFAALRKSAEDQLGYINEQLGLLIGNLNTVSGFSIDVGGISGNAGQSGGHHLYGGVIPEGTIGTVHGNETYLAAPKGVDISVLNAQTSSVLESALMGAMGNAGGNSNVSNVTYNNNFNYVVQSNAQGFMADGAARAARGF